MNVFKNYAELMKKQFPIVILYCGIMVLLVSLLSNSTQEKTFTGYEQTKVKIAVYNYDLESVLSEGLLDYLENFCEIVSISDNRQKHLDALYYRNVYYILTIPKYFSDNFLDEKDCSLRIESVENTKETNYVNQAVTAYLDYVRFYRRKNPEASLQNIIQLVDSEKYAKTQVVDIESKTVNEENAHKNYFFSLLGYILPACLILTICTSMSAYRNVNITKRHLISPMTPGSINMQLLLAAVVYAFMYTLLLLALGFFIGNDNDFGIITMLYWLNTFAYVAGIVMFSFFLSLWLKHRGMIIAVANLTSLFLSFICGVFIRQEYLSKGLVKAASFTPMYWFVRGNDIIMKIEDIHMEDVIELGSVLGIQLLFTLAFFCIGMVGTKIERDSR